MSVKAKLVQLIFGDDINKSRQVPQSGGVESESSKNNLTSSQSLTKTDLKAQREVMYQCIKDILDVRNVVQQLAFIQIFRNFLASRQVNCKTADTVSVECLRPQESQQLDTAKNESPKVMDEPGDRIAHPGSSNLFELFAKQASKPSLLKAPNRYRTLIKSPKIAQTGSEAFRLEVRKESGLPSSTPKSTNEFFSEPLHSPLKTSTKRLDEDLVEFLSSEYLKMPPQSSKKPTGKIYPISETLSTKQASCPILQSLILRASQFKISEAQRRCYEQG